MAFLIAILVSLALFAAFIGVTVLERTRGARFFAARRAALDARVTSAAMVVRTADPLDFVVRSARTLFGHIFHDIANVAWATVRMLERTLATAVKKLRAMRHHEARTETNSSYVKSISSHGEMLRAEPSSEETSGNTVG